MSKTKLKETEIGMIPEDWEVKELNELCTLITDGKHGDCKNEIYSGYYFLSCKDVNGGILYYSKARQITKQDFLETDKRTNLQIGNILLTNSGTIGRLAIAKDPEKTRRTTFQKSVAIVKNKQELIQSEFLYYYFMSKEREIKELSGGTTQKNLLLKDLRSFKVAVPNKVIQKSIAKILSDLDLKIELLQKQNETLEAIAQAIFKHWFVDFEFPNEGGKPYKSSGGEMVFNEELGKEIPKGWEIKKLGDFVDVQKGLSYKGKFLSEEGIPMSNLGTFKPLAGFKIDGLKHYTGEYKERHLVVPGDLIIANTDITQKRDVLGSPALIPQNIGSDRALFTHHIFAIRHKQNNLTNYFIYFLLQTPEYRSRAIGFATGTTVLALPKEAILNLLFAVAPENIITKFNDMAKFLFYKLELNNQQTQSLQKIRDSLLPKLMSGEIRDRCQNG